MVMVYELELRSFIKLHKYIGYHMSGEVIVSFITRGTI